MVQEDFRNENDLLRHIMTVDDNDGVFLPEKISDIGKGMIKKQQDLFNFEEFGL